MQYYTVTEGRATRLDLMQLRDRSTYGLDWMVFDASSDPDALRQWDQFKSGTHIRQDELAAEAARYRAVQGYAPPWQAEREVVAAEAAEQVRAEQSILRASQEALDAVRQDLEEIARPSPGPIQPRRRAATTPKRRRVTAARTKPSNQGSSKGKAAAKSRRRR
jgi:hypothetical protein